MTNDPFKQWSPAQSKDNKHNAEFPLKGIKPRAGEGRDRCCGPAVGFTSLPAPMGYSYLGENVSHPHPSLIQRGPICGTNPSSSPDTHFLPPPLLAAAAQALDRAQTTALVPSPIPRSQGDGLPGHPPMSCSSSAPPKHSPPSIT